MHLRWSVFWPIFSVTLHSNGCHALKEQTPRLSFKDSFYSAFVINAVRHRDKRHIFFIICLQCNKRSKHSTSCFVQRFGEKSCALKRSFLQIYMKIKKMKKKLKSNMHTNGRLSFGFTVDNRFTTKAIDWKKVFATFYSFQWSDLYNTSIGIKFYVKLKLYRIKHIVYC